MSRQPPKDESNRGPAAAGAPPEPEQPTAAPEHTAPPESPEDIIARLRQELETARAEAVQHYDRFLRERAELENFKKRMQREKTEALRFAAEGLIRDLLPLLDNLQRAIDHAASGGNGQPLVEGVRLAFQGALDALERHGVTRIEAVGKPFDPTVHEAIVQIPDPTREPNHVVEQFRPGYFLHERLLRPAQVSVATKPAVESEGERD
jgi:molecular chaperone GrpE